ncbi:MAG: hypothetical protein V5789_12020 [Colwellia sp.]
MKSIAFLILFVSVNTLAAKNIEIVPKNFSAINVNVFFNYPDSIHGGIENKVSYSLSVTIALEEIYEYYNNSFSGEWDQCFSNIKDAEHLDKETLSAWFNKKRKLGVFLSTTVGEHNERQVIVSQYSYKDKEQFKSEFKGAGC